ncbi:substrate-binding domain-containing protein [Novosphingobium resinovorum]|uniref:substrate-binding domain-containing protein n=1 Tax=Novosphingobium resinovorum TaxID=158500 RepID=UPI00360ED39B
MVRRAETPNIAGMTSPETTVATRPTRRRPASSIERAAIEPCVTERAGMERAAYVPDFRGPLRSPECADPVPANHALVLLVHDGSEHAIRDAVQDAMAKAMANAVEAGTHLFAPHVLGANAMKPDGIPAAFARLLARHRPAGVVLMPPLSAREDLADLCLRAQARCLRVGAQPGLSCDERGGAALVVRRLVTLGHTRIGLVADPESSAGARQRELGYLDAMAELGLDRGPALIVPGDNSFESGIAAGRLLLEISPRPTAILACNDEMAAGVLHAAAQDDVPVPQALSVVGFDDTSLAHRLLPPLASVHVPWNRIGEEAAKWILAESSASLEPFEPHLMERASLGPIG